MTTTEREKCAEILARLGFGWREINHRLLNALAEARALARREALEEAAKIAKAHIGQARKDRLSKTFPPVHPDVRIEERGEDIAAGIIAQNIRYLIQLLPETPSSSVPAEPWKPKLCKTCNGYGVVHVPASPEEAAHNEQCPSCSGNGVEPTPPDTEAWKRVPVTAWMLMEAYRNSWGTARTPPTLLDVLVTVENAARAKIKGE